MSWVRVQNGLTGTWAYALALHPSGDIFVGLSREFPALNGGGVFRSTNNGTTWLETALTRTEVQALSINSSGEILAGTYAGISRSSDNGAQWVLANAGIRATDIRALAARFGRALYAGSWGGGILRTSNRGNNWASTGLMNAYVQSLAVNNAGHIFAGLYGSSLRRSTDDGNTWLASGPSSVTSLAINAGGTVFGGTPTGVSRSTDNGQSWMYTLAFSSVQSVAVSSNADVYAGTFFNGVFRSTDNGQNWTSVGLTRRWILSIAATSAGTLLAGSDAFFDSLGGGIYRSTDAGNTWTHPASGFSTLSLLANPSGHVYAGTSDGFYHSVDDGKTWLQMNSGLTTREVVALAMDEDGYLFAGTGGEGVFRSTRSTTSTPDENPGKPSSIVLEQNYPNPFNPTTTVSFVISHSSLVSLKVFDVLGRKVATPVNEQLSAGTYKQIFNAEDLSSGVYFYRLTAGGYTQTKTMVVLK